MKNLLSVFIFMLISATASIGQFTIEPSEIEFVGDNDNIVEVKVSITNTSNEDMDIFWEFVKSDSYPEDWVTTVCDINTCYAPNTLMCPSTAPNKFEAGKTLKFSFKVWVNGSTVNASSCGMLKLYSDSTFTMLVGETSCAPVATNDVSYEELSIYPNPTTDFFQLNSDDNISTVSIYNVVGRKVMQMQHNVGEMHDVSQLRAGMYIVRMLDRNDDVVKTMRLSKR